MTFTTKALIAVSSLLLTHSCYSAHEHSSTSTSTLPLDITLETILAALLLILGIVLGNTHQLRPISLRVWAGKLEREKGGGPFTMLEERLGFLDIRGRREEFAAWARLRE